jgi:serralysin
VGGQGNDKYTVDNAADVVTELAGGGTDTVKTSLALYDMSLSALEVENLEYSGAASFTGTGNALANKITGGALGDILTGLGGKDTLTGGLGADTFVYLSGADSNGNAADSIADFVLGTDLIGLSAIDAITGGADDAFTLIGSLAFSGQGQLRVFDDIANNRTVIEGNTNANLANTELTIYLDGVLLAATITGTSFVL